MYRIDKESYGFRLTVHGLIDGDEMQRLLKDTERSLSNQEISFCALVDLRQLAPLDREGQELMLEAQKLARQKGMERSALVLDNPVTTMQFRRLSFDSGISEWERYIDASTEPDWEQVALGWLVKGIDPEKKEKAPDTI